MKRFNGRRSLNSIKKALIKKSLTLFLKSNSYMFDFYFFSDPVFRGKNRNKNY